MLASLAPGVREPILGGLVTFVVVRNPRGAMDLFGAPPLVMSALALATLAFLFAWLRAAIVRSPLAQVGYGLIAGGAAGNVVDRVAHGYVVDFIEPTGFYAFNVADVAIVGGLAALASAVLRRTR